MATTKSGQSGSKTKKILQSVGTELKSNPPSVLQNTEMEKGPDAAAKQKVAILLSKARKRGATIPKKGVLNG